MTENRSAAEGKDEVKTSALAYLACSYQSSNEDDTDDEFIAPETIRSQSPTFRALPLPPSLVGMYAESDSTGEARDIDSDHERHSGRIRSFAHERGNWATYVYVPFPLELDVESNIERFLSSLPFKLQPCEDFHVSLSKTVILKHHWIQPFVNQLKSTLQSQKKFHVSLPFLEVYINEEETRTFLGLKVEGGSVHLHRLVHVVDECLSKYRLPAFYETPSFHLSIGWCLGNNLQELKEQLTIIQGMFESHFQDSSTLCVATVNGIKCKTGDKIFNIPLLCS